MKYKKLSLALCSGLMLFSGLGTSTILAAEEINKDDLLEEYGNIKNEVNGTFDSMKDKYTDLSNNFGKIEKPNVDEVYQSYLNDIKEGQKELEIDKKLEAIKNTDLSIDNSEMKKTYEEAKKDAANKLSEAKNESNVVKDKFDITQKEQTEKEKQLEQKRIEAAETQYNNIVAGYYETLNKKGELPDIKTLGLEFSQDKLVSLMIKMEKSYPIIMSYAKQHQHNKEEAQENKGFISGICQNIANRIIDIKPGWIEIPSYHSQDGINEDLVEFYKEKQKNDPVEIDESKIEIREDIPFFREDDGSKVYIVSENKEIDEDVGFGIIIPN